MWIVYKSTACCSCDPLIVAAVWVAFSSGPILLCLYVCDAPLEEVCVLVCVCMMKEPSGNYRTHSLSNEMSAAWLPLLSLITHHYRDRCADPPSLQKRSEQVKQVSHLASLFSSYLPLFSNYTVYNNNLFYFYWEYNFKALKLWELW